MMDGSMASGREINLQLIGACGSVVRHRPSQEAQQVRPVQGRTPLPVLLCDNHPACSRLGSL